MSLRIRVQKRSTSRLNPSLLAASRKESQLHFSSLGERGASFSSFNQVTGSIDKVKLRRIVDDIREGNSAFNKYLEDNHIRSNDIKGLLQLEQGKIRPHHSMFSSRASIQNSTEAIRCGFRAVMDKLRQERSRQFVKQAHTLKESLNRDSEILDQLGYGYCGSSVKMAPYRLASELSQQEKHCGRFSEFGECARDEVLAIQQLESFFRSIIIH